MKSMSAVATLTLLIAFVATLGMACAKSPEAAVDGAAKKQYTCPMHPEVVQNAPGKCPKCNMNLELKK